MAFDIALNVLFNCFTVNNTPMEQQMSNLHHPARLDGESFPEYRQRRADSQKVVARALRGRLYFGPAKDQTRRVLVKVHGRRQALKQIKAERAAMKLEHA